MLDKNTAVLIVGLGQVGGSYARALTEKGFSVAAIDRDPGAIAYAKARGWIARGETEPTAETVGAADLLIFALYPGAFVEWLRAHQGLIRPGALLTDVTGVKSKVVREIQAMLRPDLEYIGAHPMAGREGRGVAHSAPELFRGANYIVTPTERNTPEAIRRCRALGETLGFARISEISPERHDEMIAFLSQLTHCIAVALMCAGDSPDLADFTGDSFRDLTRIAKINDELWSELMAENRAPLLAQMDRFEDAFRRLRRDVAEGDAEDLRACMRLSAERRKRFDREETR